MKRNRSITKPVLSDMPLQSLCNQDHEYVVSEFIWPLAIVCVKCGHTLIKNPDGSVIEKYGPVR